MQSLSILILGLLLAIMLLSGIVPAYGQDQTYNYCIVKGDATIQLDVSRFGYSIKILIRLNNTGEINLSEIQVSILLDGETDVTDQFTITKNIEENDSATLLNITIIPETILGTLDPDRYHDILIAMNTVTVAEIYVYSGESPCTATGNENNTVTSSIQPSNQEYTGEYTTLKEENKTLHPPETLAGDKEILKNVLTLPLIILLVALTIASMVIEYARNPKTSN